jgi:kynurenine 3-monooxygenase
MTPPISPVTITGAGPTGALLAIFLRRRGIPVTLYERRADPRTRPHETGRSINLAMADRGIHALKLAGVYPHIRDEFIPMRGRMIHGPAGTTSLQPYGQRPNEVIYSISRNRLNDLLLDVATKQFGAQVHFEHELRDLDLAKGLARIHSLSQNRSMDVPAAPLLVAEGAGSAARNRLAAGKRLEVRIETLEHSYKELTIPAGANSAHVMAREALHIWPRGNFMLIALPNTDGTFTATLFLQRDRFEELRDPAGIGQFFQQWFPDAARLMPRLIHDFQHHPTGALATVYASPWRHEGSVLLMGDAAHGIVPFHGQGMNCCFEDCVEFDALIDHHVSWEPLFEAFERARKPNTDAIAAMAIENYLEMRERVADERFQLQKLLSLELEKRHPQRFIPRYSMVSFHHEIGYATAAARGAIQQEILDGLTERVRSIGRIDYERAAREIEARLTPIGAPG